MDGLRAQAMKRRLARTAAHLGVAEEGMALALAAFDLGMLIRGDGRFDDHHPDYLHPSRSALILMDDVRVGDVSVLAAALVTETRSPELRVPPAALQALGPDVVDIVAAVPGPGEERLLERLVGASNGTRLVALAERLDHARHLHMRERDEWEGYHAETRDVYAPLAARTNPVLAGRLAWWCTTFQQRFLDP